MTKDINNLNNVFKDMDDKNVAGLDTIVVEASMIPKLCLSCINNPICSPLTVYVDLFKTGINSEITSCVYFRKIPK